MRRLRTTASRWAAVACLSIGLLFAHGAIVAPSVGYTVLEATVAVIALLTAAKMWLHNCFESHLAAAVVVVATAGSTLLALTAGVPGQGAADLTTDRAIELALCAAVVVLLGLDGRVRRDHARRRRRFYAR